MTKKTAVVPRKSDSKAQRFVAAYLANGQNATQAAIAAGYTERSAHTTGHRLLRNADVAQLLTEAAKKALERAKLTTDNVLHEVACIVHCDPRKLVDEKGQLLELRKLDEATARAIASVEFDDKGNLSKVRFWDKNTAAGNAMRYLGLLKPEIPVMPTAPAGATTLNVNVRMQPLEAYQRLIGKGVTVEGTATRVKRAA